MTGSPSAWRIRDARFTLPPTPTLPSQGGGRTRSLAGGPRQPQGEAAALAGRALVEPKAAAVPCRQLAADVQPQARSRRAGARPLAADEPLEDAVPHLRRDAAAAVLDGHPPHAV